MEKVKKRNQIFSYLYVLAIIMVIDDHTNTRVGLFANIFPYNSFYMPLFVFIAGYFYQRRSIVDCTKHKVKKLLIPYLVWNVVAIFVTLIIDAAFGTKWFGECQPGQFLSINLLKGSTTTLNYPAWFIIMLFWVSMIYNTIHHRIKDNRIIDGAMTIIYIILGIVSVYLCSQGYEYKSDIWLFVLKLFFFMQFYHLGTMFRKYFEKPLLKCNKIIVCGACIIINIMLICIFGNKIEFYRLSEMDSFSYWFLPIITSITGIVFYYEVMEFLSRKIGPNKVIDFISRNTFTILETHVFFMNITNFFYYIEIKNGSKLYNDFSIEQFVGGAGYRYGYNNLLINFVFGLLGSIFIAYVLEKVKNKIKEMKSTKKRLNEVD